MPHTPSPPSPYPDGRTIPRQSLMLRVKLERQPAVHFAYDRCRRFEETAVTILDQAGTAVPWDLKDVVAEATLFLVGYLGKYDEWPAELRAPGAGRTKADRAS